VNTPRPKKHNESYVIKDINYLFRYIKIIAQKSLKINGFFKKHEEDNKIYLK